MKTIFAPAENSKRFRAKFFPSFCLAIIVCWFATGPAFGQRTGNIQSLAQLRKQLAIHLDQPRFADALWGVKIVSLDTDKTIFESHADRLMSPASNCKLFTAALALDRFGGDFKISTSVYVTAKVNWRGTVHGNLIIVGHGDPSWNRRRFGTNFWKIFDPFITVVTNAGVRRIKGDIVADATFFRGPPTGASWTVDDLQDYYGAKICALALEDNYANVRIEPGASIGTPCQLLLRQPDTGLVLSNYTSTAVTNGVRHVETYRPLGSSVVYVFGHLPLGNAGETLDVPVPRPAEWFAAALKEALMRHGIRVSGKAGCVVWPQIPAWRSENSVKLGEVLSPPLRDVVRGFMKPSQNLEVDMLLAHIGEKLLAADAPPWETSEESGIAALHRFLADPSLPSKEVHFDEGSGLSRNNLTTANAIVALLQYMSTRPEAQDFINSLPIAGVDGTLRRRMKGTPAAGKVHAKTGSLRWANSLSGYVKSAAGERLAFSLLLNRYVTSPEQSSRDQLDAIAEMLAEFSGRSTQDAASLQKDFAPFGQLILTQLVTAPFPDPARANGHTYHGKFYSAKEHYSDSTVAIFIPKGFHTTGLVDFVVHFHGWNNSVANSLKEYKLIEQLAASGKNAVLVVPEGPRDAPDSFGGKLEDLDGFKRFMGDVVGVLRQPDALNEANLTIGRVILSGHSGGYHVMAAILDRGGLSDKIKEVWLFDALYAGTDNFMGWQEKEDGWLLDIYTDHGGTKKETEHLMASLKKDGISFFASEDTNATPENLQANKLVFLHSDLAHNDVVAKRATFEQFLKTSCLENE